MALNRDQEQRREVLLRPIVAKEEFG